MDSLIPNLSIDKKYRLLEYISLPTTAYINTGIQANPAYTNAKMRVSPTSLSGTTGLFGARSGTSASSKSYNFFGAVSGANGRFDNTNPSVPYAFVVNAWYDIELGHNGLKGTFKVNDGEVVTGGSNMANENVGEIFIGNFNNVGTPFSSGTPAKWGKVTIFDGNEMVGNFIPVERTSDNELGFFDTVSRKFFTNEGSGTFTKGDYVRDRKSNIIIDGVSYDIPDDITLLEYIESSGTQYIDTGISSKSTLSVIMDIQRTVEENKLLFGYRVSVNTNIKKLHMNVGGNSKVTYAYNATPVNTTTTADLDRHIWELTPTYLKYDNAILEEFTVDEFSSTGCNLYLFAVNQNGSPYLPSSMKAYALKVYDEATLIRDMIPAKNSSNVVGMYDLVTGTFFTNAGTGTFTGGDEYFPIKTIGDRNG